MQSIKASPPMVLTLAGMVMLSRALQLKKACSPMLASLFPRVTFLSPGQSKKALLPMAVTLSGMVMLVMPVRPKAANIMSVTPLPMVTLVSPLQSPKALTPMILTLSGMVTAVICVPTNACAPIAVTGRLLYEAGITTAPVVTVPLATLYSLLLFIAVNASPGVPAATGAAVADSPFVHVEPLAALVYVPAFPVL